MDAVLELLSPEPGQTYLDCTAGLGGHAAAMAQRVGPTGTVVLNDVDPSNLESAAQRLREMPGAPTVITFAGNFVDAPRRLMEKGLSVDMALADLGFASNQMEDGSRGLSFMREGPLDMRLDPTLATTAADLVNRLSEEELTEIIRDFGEEPRARRVAQKLVEARSSGPIRTTLELAAVVRSALGGAPTRDAFSTRNDGSPSRSSRGPSRIDPATRTFQALRIAVNDELGALGSFLESVGRASTARAQRQAGTGTASSEVWLRSGARVGVISFHSLEDRMVKRRFSELEGRGVCEVLTRRPVEATDEENAVNPRARSAKLRVLRVDGEQRGSDRD